MPLPITPISQNSTLLEVNFLIITFFLRLKDEIFNIVLKFT